MKTKQIATFLRTVSIFHELPEEQLNRVAQSAEQISFRPGEQIQNRFGEEPTLVVMVEGECQAYLEQGELDLELEVQRLYPGDFIGAEAVVDGRASTATVRSVTAGRAVVLRKEIVAELLEQEPSFSKALCHTFATALQQGLRHNNSIRFAYLSSFPDASSTVRLLPRRISSVSRSLVVESKEGRVTVAMVDPNDLKARSFIQYALRDYHVQFVAISDDDFEKHGRKLLGERIELHSNVTPFEKMSYQDAEGEVRSVGDTSEEDLLSHLLTLAIRRGASDVHFEPYQGKARVRLRVDGRMVAIDEPIAPTTYRHLAARVKILAGLNTTRIRRPQFGRFLVEVDERQIEFRVAISPCHGGEKIVLRIVAPSHQLGKLSQLIVPPALRTLSRDLFQNPSGLILVTGPSGAGKTTTLYAALESVLAQDSSKNVVTIEDPVEYDLPFATQIQVNREAGMDAATILRSVLRQDPDIILVGEIRDPESAAMAAEAATTGHLVLSSLHTYTALEAIVRLRDLKVPPYLISAGLHGIITQQLVPRLAPGYTEEVPPTDRAVRHLIDLGIMEPEWSGTLLRGRETAEGPPGGEQGRVAIYEMISVTPELRAAIDNSASYNEMRSCLNATCYASFADYARCLLVDGLVGPDRISAVVPRGPALIGEDANGSLDWAHAGMAMSGHGHSQTVHADEAGASSEMIDESSEEDAVSSPQGGEKGDG